MDKAEIGKYIIEERGNALRVSQPCLAELSGVSVHTLPNLETGSFSLYGLLVEGRQKDRQCCELLIDEKDRFTHLFETSAYGTIGAVCVKV